MRYSNRVWRNNWPCLFPIKAHVACPALYCMREVLLNLALNDRSWRLWLSSTALLHLIQPCLPTCPSLFHHPFCYASGGLIKTGLCIHSATHKVLLLNHLLRPLACPWRHFLDLRHGSQCLLSQVEELGCSKSSILSGAIICPWHSCSITSTLIHHVEHLLEHPWIFLHEANDFVPALTSSVMLLKTTTTFDSGVSSLSPWRVSREVSLPHLLSLLLTIIERIVDLLNNLKCLVYIDQLLLRSNIWVVCPSWWENCHWDRDWLSSQKICCVELFRMNDIKLLSHRSSMNFG